MLRFSDPNSWRIATRYEHTPVFSGATLSVWKLATISAVFAGPFGTYAQLELFPRLLFWGCAIGFGMITAIVSRNLLLPFTKNRNPIVADIINAHGFSIAYVPIMWVFVSFVFPLLSSDAINDFTQLSWVASIVYVISILSCVGIALLRKLSSSSAVSVSEIDRSARIFDRLPGKQIAGIVRLAAENHYVVLVLDNGQSHRLLMRFSDAVVELDATPGYVTHRSHWVATSAIASIDTHGGKTHAVLKNGDTIPVSRKYRIAFVQDGWIEKVA